MKKDSQRIMNARLQAALKLQQMAFDAANRTPGSYMNKDRAIEVVDSITDVVLLTLNQYFTEEKKDATSSNK
jgi:hypothetical protein